MKRNKILGALFILVSMIVLYFQYQRYVSAEIQAKIFFDHNSQNFNDRDLYFIYSIDDFYPSLNTFAMPMKAMKAKYLIKKDSIPLAINYLLESTKENPYMMFAESELSQLFYNLKDYEKFEKYARKAMRGNPNNAVHYIAIAKLMKQQDKIDSLMYYYDKVGSKIGDRDHQIYLITLSSLVGDSLLIQKYNAKEIAKDAKRIFPKEPQITLLTDYILYTEENVNLAKEKHDAARDLYISNKDESLKLFQEAINLNPTNQQYNDNFILANYQSGNYNVVSDLYFSYKENFTQLESDIMYYLGSSLYFTDKINLGCEILIGLESNNLFAFDKNNFRQCY